MKSFQSRLEDNIRTLAWYLDYFIFKLLRFPIPEKALPEVKNILIVELKYIGDLIISTPTIRAVKQHFPKSNIDIIVPEGMEDVLYANPNINKIIPWKGETIKQNFSKHLQEIKGKYDLAIILHNGTFIISKLLLKAKIPYRVGCTRCGILEGKGFFLHKATKPTYIWKHKVEDNLDVIRSTLSIDTNIKSLELYTKPESINHISKFLKENKIDSKDFIVCIHPGPQHKTHEWLPERFAQVANTLIKEKNAKIIFTGNEKDFSLIQSIMKQMQYKAINSAGRTTIPDLIALIQRADLVISIDTSAMHIAAALKKPVIALFGAGNPKIWHPYSNNYKVIFKEKEADTSCMKHTCKFQGTKREMECMRAIQVNDVLKAIEEIIK